MSHDSHPHKSNVRQQLPYLRVLVPGRDSSLVEAVLGALAWSAVTSIVGWWLLSWVLAGGDWSDFFVYVVLTVASTMWTGESWYIVFRARRQQQGATNMVEPQLDVVHDVR
ncbi:MAG TPA: hypothetical protein VHU91_07055 [Mycobacteriales bacterium]|jgi:hypothetical protein|nr:hypothetical protein [Mycobacteriales bacterium]